jgi:hypothetical protein
MLSSRKSIVPQLSFH